MELRRVINYESDLCDILLNRMCVIIMSNKLSVEELRRKTKANRLNQNYYT